MLRSTFSHGALFCLGVLLLAAASMNWASADRGYVLTDADAERVVGGACCFQVMQTVMCAGGQLKDGMQEWCPGQQDYNVTQTMCGDQQVAKQANCTTPCGVVCCTYEFSYVDCSGFNH